MAVAKHFCATRAHFSETRVKTQEALEQYFTVAASAENSTLDDHFNPNHPLSLP